MLPGCWSNGKTELQSNAIVLNDTMRRVYANTVLPDGLYENVGRRSPRNHFLKVSVDNITLYGWMTCKSKKDTVYYRAKAKYDKERRKVTFTEYGFSRMKYRWDKLESFQPEDNVTCMGAYRNLENIKQIEGSIKLDAFKAVSLSRVDKFVFVRMR
jgi:hypothetical protein